MYIFVAPLLEKKNISFYHLWLYFSEPLLSVLMARVQFTSEHSTCFYKH